jgi:hypothetical protein
MMRDLILFHYARWNVIDAIDCERAAWLWSRRRLTLPNTYYRIVADLMLAGF